MHSHCDTYTRMENNSYTNVLDSTKTTAQPVYTCGLCYKDFLYYRDLAVHERMHLEQMNLSQSSLQGGVRPSYDNRQGLYNAPVVPRTTLESFDMLVKPLRGDQGIRLGQSSLRSPVPTSTPQDLDKGAQVYRTEPDSRMVPVDSRAAPVDTRALNMDMRSLPVDNRSLPLDTRAVTLDTRNIQPVDSRPVTVDSRSIPVDSRSIPVDSRSLPYSAPSYLDSVNRSIYNTDLTNKIQTSSPTAFQVQSGLRPEEYLDSQVFSKPSDPYYGIPKTHYSSLAGVEKAHPDYAPSQFGLSKLLGQTSAPYYPQPLVSQEQAKYDKEKVASHSPTTLGYYNQHSITPTEPKPEKRQPSPSPKQTLYYGQPPCPPHPVTMATNSHYQMSLTKPSHLHYPNTRELLNKYPEKPDVAKAYQSGHASAHLTLTDMYKGSQPQSQVFTPVPSQPVNLQPDYTYYKQTADLGPGATMDSKQANIAALGICECYICFAPFPNMSELSEHMKIHAREDVAMKIAAQGGTQSSPVSTNSLTNTYPSVPIQPAGSVSTNSHINTATPSPPSVAFKPVKNITQQQQYECKTCKKVFDKQAKCSRHEALHQRNIKLFYCEICEKDFTYKGNYLYHVQVVHSKNGADNFVKTETSVSKTQEVGKVVDCQICDEEVVKEQLVNHLKSHTVHTCDKCDRVFVQKTEYVEHLMNVHWRELADSSDAKSENSDNERGESNKSARTREQSEEKDSGLEEDHEKDREEMDSGETASVTKGTIPESKKKASVHSEKKLKSKVSVEIENLSKKQREMMAKLDDSSFVVTVKRKKEVTTTQEREATKTKHDDMSLESNSGFLKDTKLKFSCSKCEESFERKTDLALHVEAHNRDPSKVYCEVCSVSYGVRDRGYLIYHMKQHTDSELSNSKKSEKIKCVVCNVDIKGEKYVSHIVKEHTQFSCDLCQWSYSSEGSLFSHMKKIHSSGKVKYILKKGGGIEVQHKNVPVVYKKLKDFAPLDKDDDPGSPQGSFRCKFCERIFTKKSSLENHIKKHNAQEQQMLCEVCNTAFTSKGTYFYHVLKDHDTLSNSIPQVKNTNTEIADVKAEIESSENLKSVPTVLNPETGAFEKELTEDGKQDEGNKQPCQESSHTAVTNDTISDKKPSDVVSEIIYCRLCNKCLKRDSLFTHIKEHSFFSCDLCKYSFTKKAQYLHHRKMLHVNDIVTEEIERAEAEERLLNKAIEAGKRKRTDLIKLVTCPVCSSDFRQDKYIEHIKAHRKVIMRCRFCGKEFSKKNLHAIHEKSHERISHADNELPFPRNCPVCNMGILSRANYVQHLGEHLRQKPSCCNICNKQFIGEKILDNHKRISHDQNVRVIWTYDGEGMKFDMRTGRYFEVISDYLGEIKELNEIMKANNKPEIWHGTTPKKGKDKSSISKAQGKKYVEEEAVKMDDEDSEKVNAETSDEDYVPAKKRPYSSASAVDDDDDDDYAPTKKKKKKKKLAFAADDDSTSEEEYTNKVTRTRHSSVPLTKKALHRIRHLRARNKMKMAQKTGKPARNLRSSLPLENNKKSQSPRQNLKRNAHTDKTSLSDNPETPKRRRSGYTLEEIEKYKLKPGDGNPKAGCPLCSVKTSSRGHYEEHLRTHTGEKPYKCVCCDSRFNREWNMWVHVQKMHKDYKMKSPTDTKSPSSFDSSSSKPDLNESQGLSDKTLRTRSRSTAVEEPLSSSTPVRTSRLSGHVSTPELIDGNHTEKTPYGDRNGAAKAKIADKNGSEQKQNAALVCEYCNRKINTKWNYTQHIEWHKKEIKKKEQESKPFSCKMCSESFKKKRDLYIHTKVHTGNALDDDDMMNVSKTESDVTDTASVSLHSSVHESDMSFTKDSVDDTIGNNSETATKDMDKNIKQAAITADIGNPRAMDVPSTANIQTGSSKDSAKDLNNVEEKVQNSLCTKTNNNEHYSNTVADLKDYRINIEKLSETAVVKTSTSSDQAETCSKPSVAPLCKGNGCENESSSNEGPINEQRSAENTPSISANSDSVEQPNNGVKNDSVHSSNSSDVKRLSDSETEESKTKTTKTPPPVKKMSSESALSKWKMKVKATLSSQLELNAAKKEEEMTNPETAKLKEKLAIKGKMEKKKNFECRICGDAFDLESGFREHMDVHFNESPPYCGICDIYFMAIYPKRRLMEHNKKKHPELQS